MKLSQYAQGYQAALSDINRLIVQSDNPNGALAAIAMWLQDNYRA